MKFILVISLCIYSICFFPQRNLVPNPSFEIKNDISGPGSNGGIATIKSWMAANPGPGDYYYRNNTDLSSSVPDNIFGNQEPHSGDAYTGICIETGFIEYIEAELNEPLVKGQAYKVSFFISRSDKRKSSVKEMGVLFLPKKKEYFLGKGILLTPQIEFINGEGYKDAENWAELSDTYIAEGFETVLVIGHFIDREPDGYHGKAHYYIDDVSVIELGEEKDTVKKADRSIAEKKQLSVHTDTIRLEDLNFRFGTAIPEGNYDSLLRKPLALLLQHPKETVKIEGHTDAVGEESFNIKLSEERAKAIAGYFLMKGVSKDRILYKGYGSAHPIADNTTDEGRHKNRRVELIMIKGE